MADKLEEQRHQPIPQTHGGHGPVTDVKLGLFSLWMIGVGSFIGGNFIGWPSVLIGGFGSGLFSVCFFGVYFVSLGQVTGELAARFRESGGTYMYSKHVFGPAMGAAAGIVHIVKLISANCCMAIAISGYAAEVTVDNDLVHMISWVACYVIFTLLHCYGGYSSIYFQNVVVVMCLLVVMLYFFSASRTFDFKDNALGERGWFEGGLRGFVLGFPYGIWFFDGFEELPLAITLAGDAVKAVPMALNMSAATAVVLAVGVIFLGASSSDPFELMDSPAPLMMSFVGVWGNNPLFVLMLDLAILLGLAVSFSTFVLYSGRMIQTVAEDGLLPRPLTITNTTFGTPINATIFSSIAGFVITTTFGILFGIDKAEDALIACSLLASITCYICNFCCLHAILRSEQDILKLGHDSKCTSLDDSDTSNNTSATNIASPTNKIRRCSFGGDEPGDMRFPLGIRGVEFSIFLSLVVLACILFMFVVEEEYHLGILILISVVTLSVLLVYLLACISTEKRVHDEISDLSTRSTTPLDPERSGQ
jgi:APA family basic amino acid/polyamine antiporter